MSDQKPVISAYYEGHINMILDPVEDLKKLPTKYLLRLIANIKCNPEGIPVEALDADGKKIATVTAIDFNGMFLDDLAIVD